MCECVSVSAWTLLHPLYYLFPSFFLLFRFFPLLQQLTQLRDHLAFVRQRCDERAAHDATLQQNQQTFMTLLNQDFELILAATKEKQSLFSTVVQSYIGERLEAARPQREEANACLAVTSKVLYRINVFSIMVE
jgi:hypothetical protein